MEWRNAVGALGHSLIARPEQLVHDLPAIVVQGASQLPSRARLMVPVSSLTTQIKASVPSDKFRAAPCRMPSSTGKWLLGRREHATDAPNASHCDVEPTVVHAAILVENGFDEGGVDVRQLGGTWIWMLRSDERWMMMSAPSLRLDNPSSALTISSTGRKPVFGAALGEQAGLARRRLFERRPVPNGEEELTQFLLKHDDDRQNADPNERPRISITACPSKSRLSRSDKWPATAKMGMAEVPLVSR